MGYEPQRLGPVCFVSNWFSLDDGTLALTNTKKPGTSGVNGSAAAIQGHPVAGVSGDIGGLEADFLSYLSAAGKFFGVKIYVTSGMRDGAAQARAMFNNWLKLERGKVYGHSSLPENSRKLLDDYYSTAKESPTATEAQKTEAETKFLELAKDTKSRHSTGRAADIRLSSINAKAHRALLVKLQEVKEGNRKDIIHVESTSVVAPVDDALRRQWESIRDEQAKHILHHDNKLEAGDACFC